MNKGLKLGLWLVLVAAWSAGRSFGAEIPAIDNPMWQDPPCEFPVPAETFPPRLAELWRKALEYPDAELRRAAADVIVVAQAKGMKDLESLRQHLVEILQAADQSPPVRRAAARALIALGSREHVQLLAKETQQGDLEMARLIEPVLAAWDFRDFQPVWMKRLNDSETPQLRRLLAMRCLVTLRVAEAVPPLLKIAEDPYAPLTLRLAAAEAAGQLSDSGLVDKARRLTADPSPAAMMDRVVGVSLLKNQRSPEGISLLRELAADPEPAVAAAAVEHLFAWDPSLTYELTDRLLEQADVKLRSLAAKILVNKADEAAIQGLGPLLADSNMQLRRWVARSLAELAEQDSLRPAVLREVDRVLIGDRWQGLEQAALLCVALDHRALVERLVDLLSHRRPEVAITSAYALRKLRVPATYPVILKYAEVQFERQNRSELAMHEFATSDEQLAQLFQLFGLERFQPAQPLLLKFVPKNARLGTFSRASACWALGYLNENKGDSDLARQFERRLSDLDPVNPEIGEVRRMSAVSLGRMKAELTLPALRKFANAEGIYSDIGLACWWSIEQMTPERRPEFQQYARYTLGWFLQPIEDAPGGK